MSDIENEECASLIESEEDQSVGIVNPTPLDCDEVGFTCYKYDGTWAYDGTIQYC